MNLDNEEPEKKEKPRKARQFTLCRPPASTVNTFHRLKIHMNAKSSVETLEALMTFYIEANDIKPWDLKKYTVESFRNRTKRAKKEDFEGQAKELGQEEQPQPI